MNAQPIALGDYLARFPATACRNINSTDELPHVLRELSDQSSALDFCLMLFDPELSLPLRRRAADELEKLLASDVNQHYVLDIMLAHPLPQNTDFKAAAAAAAEAHKATRRLLDLLEESRLRCESAFMAWLVIQSRPRVANPGADSVRSRLMASGFLRTTVVELTTQTEVLTRGPALIREMSHGLSIELLQEFLAEYSLRLPPASPESSPPVVHQMQANPEIPLDILDEQTLKDMQRELERHRRRKTEALEVRERGQEYYSTRPNVADRSDSSGPG